MGHKPILASGFLYESHMLRKLSDLLGLLLATATQL
ncbi:hypothetical protein HW132_18905 [Brasilonema sp. CT11]|nr:hypothetical protein [Brasilonema sp. CT11]